MRNLFVVVLMALVTAGALPARAAPAESGNSEVAEPKIRSNAALVLDQQSGEVLYGKNAQAVVPIASITKLMTAMVVLDANLDPEEKIRVTKADVDSLRGSPSRLQVGTVLARDDLLRLALMASENRAASALGRNYPGGPDSFVRAMNLKARQIGMNGSHFADATGLSSKNVSTAEDLAVLVRSAHAYPKIREYSTATAYSVRVGGKYHLDFYNTNRLVGSQSWDIGLSKTGFINEAGRCLVMQATLAGRAVIIVLLDSWGRLTRIGDANRIRKWLELASGRGHASASSAMAGAQRSVVLR